MVLNYFTFFVNISHHCVKFIIVRGFVIIIDRVHIGPTPGSYAKHKYFKV